MQAEEYSPATDTPDRPDVTTPKVSLFHIYMSTYGAPMYISYRIYHGENDTNELTGQMPYGVQYCPTCYGPGVTWGPRVVICNREQTGGTCILPREIAFTEPILGPLSLEYR